MVFSQNIDITSITLVLIRENNKQTSMALPKTSYCLEVSVVSFCHRQGLICSWFHFGYLCIDDLQSWIDSLLEHLFMVVQILKVHHFLCYKKRLVTSFQDVNRLIAESSLEGLWSSRNFQYQERTDLKYRIWTAQRADVTTAPIYDSCFRNTWSI